MTIPKAPLHRSPVKSSLGAQDIQDAVEPTGTGLRVMTGPRVGQLPRDAVGRELRFFTEKLKVPTYGASRWSACNQLKQRVEALNTGPGHRKEYAHTSCADN